VNDGDKVAIILGSFALMFLALVLGAVAYRKHQHTECLALFLDKHLAFVEAWEACK
jgi:hypothetical protein